MKRVSPEGIPYDEIHGAMDLNGNRVLKVFYSDGRTEIIRGARTYAFPHMDKFYRTLQGLYKSRKRGK